MDFDPCQNSSSNIHRKQNSCEDNLCGVVNWFVVAVHGADVPGMVETLSIAVIGAPGVGKTSIIRQFIYNDFSEVYTPTRDRYVYRPSVILNGNMYDLKILDVPPISSFPSSSSQVR